MIYNGVYWTGVAYIQPIAELFLLGYCLSRLAAPFMEKKKGAHWAGAVYILVMLVLYFMPQHMDYFAAYTIGALAAFFVMCCVDGRNYRQKIFIAVTFFSMRWFAFAMAEILRDKAYQFAENTAYMEKHLNMWFALYVAMTLFFLLGGFWLMLIGIRCILKVYRYKYADMTKKELLMMIIPSVMGVAGYVNIWYCRGLYEGESRKTFGSYEILAFLYCAAAVTAIVVMIVLYQNIKAQQEGRLQDELLAVQMERMRKHIEQVESLYGDIRGIRHDMANHILTLEKLYEGDKKEEAKAYGEELKKALAQTAGGIKSGNPVTDVILQEWKSEAERKGIRFCCDFFYPADSNANAFDISVILNNALGNAMENAGSNESPYVSVYSYRRKNAYMIEVRNSFTGHIQWDKESGLPITSKERAGSYRKSHKYEEIYNYEKNHGYGLENIRKMARKYAGDIDIVQKDGEFCLSVMLMLA